ncbi:Glycerophosphodiester phosphodiesterase, periplasmic [Halioglobus japonicus]|nr:Glycerophosphodiester phosphodiesterase, periplasmic [Halioglobus japonicus]
MSTNPNPIIIAHRGASGYLPEHTLAAKALAHAMGANYLEQDVVLSRDGTPIVLHDIHLDSTTDVAQRFPGRARKDGRFYAIDFDLDEIRQLRVHERTHLDAAHQGNAVYPQRFPAEHALFSVPTLLEEITMLAGLDRSRGCQTGVYIELKSPLWHRCEGLDLPAAIIEVLEQTGYRDRPDQVFLQCFDDQTLQQLSRELKAKPLPMIQLIGENGWGEDSAVDYDYLRTPAGLDYVAGYAQGIGPFIPHIYHGMTPTGEPQLSALVEQAQTRGLQVHPYTFRRDELPAGIESFEQLLDIFIRQAGVDGLFTDFPDLVVDYLDKLHQSGTN